MRSMMLQKRATQNFRRSSDSVKATDEPLVHKTYQPPEQQPRAMDVETQKRWDAWAASVADRQIREYLKDMLPVVGDEMNQRVASAKDELREELAGSSTVVDLPNPIASRRMQ